MFDATLFTNRLIWVCAVSLFNWYLLHCQIHYFAVSRKLLASCFQNSNSGAKLFIVLYILLCEVNLNSSRFSCHNLQIVPFFLVESRTCCDERITSLSPRLFCGKLYYYVMN